MRTHTILAAGALLLAWAALDTTTATAANKLRPARVAEAPLPSTLLFSTDDEPTAIDTAHGSRRGKSIAARASLRPDSLAARLHRAKAVDTADSAPSVSPREAEKDEQLLSQHERPDDGNILRIAVDDSSAKPLATQFAAAKDESKAADEDQQPSRVVLASGSEATETSAKIVEAPEKPTVSTPSRWLMNLGSLLKIR